jgi:hypothetical protein
MHLIDVRGVRVKKIVCLLLAMISPFSFAVTVIPTGIPAASTTPTVLVIPQFAPVKTSPAVAPIAPAPPPSTTPSINPAANTGQQSQSDASGVNKAIGAALMAAGAAMMSQPPTVPMGVMLMAMGMLAMAQGGADDGAAAQSGVTGATSTSTTPLGVPSNPSGDSTAAPPGPPALPTDNGMRAVLATDAGKAAVAAIQAAGGDVTPNGVTMPDGTQKSWAAFSSGGAMTAAGMDGAGAMKTVGQIEKDLGLDKPKVSGMALADGGGAGGSAPGDTDTTPFNLNNLKNPFALSADAKARLAAGKTVNAGGNPIGVSMDDIFAMISRVYDRKTKVNDFISDPYGRVDSDMQQMRMPSSLSSKPIVGKPQANKSKR